MPINLRDRLTFLFNGGRGIGVTQLAGRFVKSITSGGTVTQQGAGDAEETVDLALGTAALDDNLANRFAGLDAKLVDMTSETAEVWNAAAVTDLAVAIVTGAERDRVASGDVPTMSATFAQSHVTGGIVYPIFRFRRGLRRHDFRLMWGTFYERFDGVGVKEYASDATYSYFAFFARADVVPGAAAHGLDLSAGTTVQTEQHGVETHTAYRGELPEHVADPGAHQDSPRRVSHLAVDAPAGRIVYLDTAIRHPPSEHIFSVPMRVLGTDTGGSSRFVGAAVVGLSGASASAPPVSSDLTGYPAVMNAARVAAIWQRGYNQNVYIAVANTITPTALHIAGAGQDYHVTLAQESAPVVGGTTYRIMLGRADSGVLEAMREAMENLRFSVAAGTDFLEADGTLDAGTALPVGRYESRGSGVWRQLGFLISRVPGRQWVSGTLYFPGDVVHGVGNMGRDRAFFWDPADGMPSSSTSQPNHQQNYQNSWRRF